MKKSILVSCLLLFIALASNAQVAVIANNGVAVSSLNAANVADFYSMAKKSWSDGTKVVLFDSKVDAVAGKFYGFVGKSQADLKKIWMRAQLTGEGKTPASLGSEEEMLKAVGSTPGAIGFVSAGKVSGDVKVLATIP